MGERFRGLVSVEKLTSVYSTSRCPAVLAHFDHGEGGRRKEAVFIAIGADLLACFILVVRAAVFDRVGLTAHVGHASSEPSGPSSRATKALGSLLGERWPLSRAVGAGEFYVSFAPPASVSLGRALPLVESVPIASCTPLSASSERFQAVRPERSGSFL